MHRRLWPALAALLTTLALPAHADTAALDFSHAPADTALPQGWQRYTLSRHKPPAAVRVGQPPRPGTIAPNPFYAPVRTVVIESGNAVFAGRERCASTHG
ncbi:hypothetical protein ACO2Q2_00605 [Dyella sp. KRB-257]|uniref:hypothetical protein n=1 Tax=Dyella sp. KRB-257 TaxID=3400915 RepID=UPI003C0D1B69